MEKLTGDILTELLTQAGSGKCVTIYVPLHASAAPPHMTENHIRLKNLIGQAQEELQRHHDTSKISALLGRQLHELLDNQAVWETQAPGMLICARDKTMRMFQLPIDTEEYVAVDSTFHLTPLLGLLHDAQDFYVLSLAQHNPRLFKGNLYGLEASSITFAASVEAGLHIDENNQKSEQSLSAGGSSMNTNAFNGRGGARNPQEEDRARFWRMIDHIILKKGDRSLPMVLAGIDAETSEYRHLSKYPHIVSGSLSGNFENAKLDDIFAQAYAIIYREVIEPKHQQAIEEYQRLKGTNTARVANQDDTIQEAAEAGRVDTLLVGLNRLTADTVNDSLKPVERITFPRDSLRQAIHAIALAVKNTSGKIIVLDESRLPEPRPLAAILRY